MDYIDQTLTITGSEIYYTENGFKYEVMMDWEDEIMSASAAYVCQNGGDILEIGFGMGISANYIQSHSITSHTICENHPQVIPLALEWAEDKPNVTIITSSWYDAKDIMGTFDGIFYDAFADSNWMEFSSSLVSMCNPNAVSTWFNGTPAADDALDYPGLLYDSYSVNPEPNCYFNHPIYFLPKWQL